MDERRSGLTWLWTVLAFLVGLGIGGGFYLWQSNAMRADLEAAKRSLASQVASLTADNATLQTRLSGADASVKSLGDQLAKYQGGSTGTSTASTDATGGTPAGGTSKATGPLEVTERSVTGPDPTHPGDKLTLMAKVKGAPDKVNMRVVTTPGGAFDKTYFLGKVSDDGTVQTWKKTIQAPPKGTYRYYADAFRGTTKVSMPGVSAWTFQVVP